MRRVIPVLTLAAAAAVAVVAFLRAPANGAAPAGSVAGFTAEERERILQHSPLGDPPRDPTNAVFENPDAARLGQRLFFDPGFSRDGSVSCATCHAAAKGLADAEPLPARFTVERHVPTLWNVAYNRWFFWDGRADSLWSQALQPLENPREQASTRLQVAHRIVATPALRAAYEKVFGAAPDLSDGRRFPPAGSPFALPAEGPIRAAWASMAAADQTAVNRVFANAGKAIAAYERGLVSRRSAFDTFADGLRTGDETKLKALPPQAQRGLKLFVGRANCRLCHSGPAFSDGEFHNIGVPPRRGAPAPDRFEGVDLARRDPFNTAGEFSDDRASGAQKLGFLTKTQDLWGQVKTPTLRNVAKTAPYMHQGQFASLQDVLSYYSTLKGMVPSVHSDRFILVPLQLTPEESVDLAAFLESLTDEQVDERLLKPLK